MNAWSGTVSRVVETRAYVDLTATRGYEVEAAIPAGVTVASGSRVLVIEYDSHGTYGIVAVLA